MLAEQSIKSTNRWPWPLVPFIRGPARASIASATARSCRNKSRLRLSRWNRLLTCRSSRLLRHKNVLGTCDRPAPQLEKIKGDDPDRDAGKHEPARHPSGELNSPGETGTSSADSIIPTLPHSTSTVSQFGLGPRMARPLAFATTDHHVKKYAKHCAARP